MQDWSDGYVTDIGYTYGYYGELNPLRARMALLNAGIVPPDVRTACELGFGQGVSVNIHDAAASADWYGTDFNPAHAGFASQLAGAAPLAGRLCDQAFEEYCHRSDLPDFDFIALHGIWSWVSDANRAHIADFIKRKLKVGGVLYVSYNTQPGWAPMAPVRDLLASHVDTMGARGTPKAERIGAALDFADRLMANAAYAKANPLVPKMLEKLREQDRNYLAHEYLNQDWLPMPFARMADWMGSLKLQFAVSANYLDQVAALNLTSEQQQILAGIPDPVFGETVRDFMVNQRFRRDYWVRGARRLRPLEQAERMRAERVVLVTAPAAVKYTTTGALGEATLQEDVYRPVVEALADHRPRTIGEVEQAVARQGVSSGNAFQAIVVLLGTGALQAACEPQAAKRAAPAAQRLNAELVKLARAAGDVPYLAAPVTGGGITVGRIDQLFLMARNQGIADASGWARFASDVLERQGQRLHSGGKPFESAELQAAELLRQAERLARERLPTWKALGIVA